MLPLGNILFWKKSSLLQRGQPETMGFTSECSSALGEKSVKSLGLVHV